MDRTDLKLVAGPQERRRTPVAVFVGVIVLAAAAVATLFGADASRLPQNAPALAESALAQSFAAHDDRPARVVLDRLQAHLSRAPLDSASRMIAASLRVEIAGDSRRAAADQAMAATRLAPNDERIAQGAARVLVRCGQPGLALAEVARIFGYAPDDGAATLAEIEPFLPADLLDQGIPATPAAWRAWSARLRMAGRENEADARLGALLARWPDDLGALGIAASIAVSRNRLDELTRLVSPLRALPDTPATATLHAYRARSKEFAGDAAGARADALLAIELSREDPYVLALAGDSVAASDPTLAREFWNRALYLFLGADATRDAARWIRARIARLDESEGRAGDALRAWRGILAEFPENGEAKQRIADLTGDTTR